MEQFLLISFVFLIAGVFAVPIASKLGLGSVLGYLIAGIILGPVLTGLGVDVVSLQHFAEFGVVMMLFLVGLELEPRLLWEMRNRLLGLGGLQVAGTTALIMAAAMVLGQPFTIALSVGLVLALSSTAIVLQTLNEKGLMKSDGGQASFSVLLFQDIAVIPMLALIPLLALPELMDMSAQVADHTAPAAAHAVTDTASHAATTAGHADGGHADTGHGSEGHGSEGDHGIDLNLIAHLPGWAQALITLLAIGAVVLGGSLLTRPLFRFIAMAKLRELFIATALMMVIGIALLMLLVGLSPALGTFLAGVVLANSEYRHELESDIDPFRGLLLGLFFMTVGALIDFDLLFGSFGTYLALTIGVMAIKALVLLCLAFVFRLGGADRWLFTLGLAQAGEFGFVLLSFTVANHVLPQALADQLLLVVALSMLLTPLLFILYDKVLAPRYSVEQAQEADEIDMEAKIIIAGLGRFGGIVNRILRSAGHNTVVLDHSSHQLAFVRAFGFKAFFGDATRPDLLHAAGIEEAQMLIICIDNPEQTTEMVKYVHEHYPHVHIIARAHDRTHVYALYAAGCRDIIRETFDGAVRTGRSALEALGMHPHEAETRMKDFNRRDRKYLADLAQVYDPDIPLNENAAYVERAREISTSEEQELRGDLRQYGSRIDRGWQPPRAEDVAAESERHDHPEAES